jgi:hypothetical protein
MLIVKPIGGLANRMRVIDSSISVSRKLEMPLAVIWNRDHSINCKYSNLFQPSRDFEVRSSWYDGIRSHVRVWESLSYIIRDRIRFIWKSGDTIYIFDNHPSRLKEYDFSRFHQTGNIFISTAHRFYSPAHLDTFRPVPDLQARVDKLVSSFSRSTIGVHIRRTDSRRSILNSPDEQFIKVMQAELERNPDTLFFLTTDDPGLKTKLCEEFAGKIITNDHSLSRSDVEGIRNALVDLYCLSHTTKILGSYWSSFSGTAALLSGIPLEIVRSGG